MDAIRTDGITMMYCVEDSSARTLDKIEIQSVAPAMRRLGL